MRKVLLLLILFTVGITLGQTKVGSTAAPFLNIGVGPRAISMGGAFTASANDITALYWNPAGVSRLETSNALFAHSKWFADITYNWAGVSLYLGDIGTLGMSITYLDYGDIEVTTLTEQEGTGEFYSASDVAMSLTYAYNLTDRFSIGASTKYIRQKIWNSSASAVAFDIGVLFLSDFFGTKIGASITNFGGDMQIDGKDLFVQHDVDPNIYGNNDQILAKLNTDTWPLPLTFRVGVAWDLIKLDDHTFTFGVDALHPSDNSESLNIGAEYVFSDLLSLRGGYKSLFLENSEEGMTLGVGLKHFFSPSFGIYIDYAYQDFGILDNTQHFSLGVSF